MANSDTKGNAVVNAASTPLKEFFEAHWGRGYTGTKEALIATGLFKEEWFPDEAGTQKRSAKRVVDGRDITIVRQTKRLFFGSIHYTDEERERYQALQQQRKCADEFRKAIDCFPRSAEAFRAHHVRRAQIDGSVFMEFIGPDAVWGGGYSFAPESQDEIREAFEDLIAAISDARVVFSGKERARCLRALREKYAGDIEDAAAASFIARLNATPPSSKD
jgi:hypothetical protein